MSGLGFTFLRRGGQAHPTAGSDYIKFADAEVQRVLMANGVSSDGVGITKDDAARVTIIGTWFKGNTTITSFNELIYFTGITSFTGGWQTSSFYGCTNLVELTLPPNCKNLPTYFVQSCTKLKTIYGLEQVTSIGQGATYGCSSLYIESLNLPYLAGTLRQYALTSPTIMRIDNLGNLESIGGTTWEQNVFSSKTTFMRLPATLTSISAWAFQNMAALKVVISDNTTPPTCTANIFSNYTGTIYVPDASVDAYKAATGWATYASRIKGISEYNG